MQILSHWKQNQNKNKQIDLYIMGTNSDFTNIVPPKEFV